MPTPAQSAKVMLFNRGNKTGKHYTKTEIEKRQNAEEKIKRAEVVLKTPAFLKEKSCAAALKIWKEIIKESCLTMLMHAYWQTSAAIRLCLKMKL